MSSRRRFLKAGLGACAAGALSLPASAKQAAPRYYKIVFDERFEDARTFAMEAMTRHIPAAAIRGDVTRLFYEDLDLRWKQGPVLLAGYTTQASLFCLELLARDRGMRVTQRVMKPGDRSGLVCWTIAPNA